MQLFDPWISFLILVFCVLWSLVSINVVYNIILRAVYIRVQVQETWGSKHPLVDFNYKLKIGPNLGDWIFKLGGVFS